MSEEIVTFDEVMTYERFKKGKYKLTLNFTVDYSTKVIGERLTR